VYICYIDESGTPEVHGNTSHYVLAGLSVPIWHWRTCEDEITAIKNRYALGSAAGSRATFLNHKTGHVIKFHKPHPAKVMKRYQLDEIEDRLKSKGVIK